jgi:uroporphyrin-III C-methyltransferase / precorrin-2 dehydrogenase / sirohydrochlorin ferrochelatase
VSVGYPVVLDLAGRRVVVVGAGSVAERRVAGLRDVGADVHVVAPVITGHFDADVTVHRRSYVDGDLDGAWMAHACTDDPAVNAEVAAAAEQRQIPCVRADAAPDGTARTPAVARSGEVVVAVSSDDPVRSVRIRNRISTLLDRSELPVRRSRRDGAGRVTLVGGGPGDPGLITVEGRALVADADVLVVDRLAPRGLLDTVDDDVEVIDVGKAPYRHGATQQEINDLLVDRARRGLHVVRLKGGDPFVLGRGGEEVAACTEAGVPVHVVPGVTSALAGPAMAGIPLTHRGIAADFAVVSAHLDPTHTGSTVDWAALASGPATLVLLMAMERLESVCQTLIGHGRSADTPAAVVQEATTPAQRTLTSTLGSLADDVRQAGMGSPAVVVVGEVVRLARTVG